MAFHTQTRDHEEEEEEFHKANRTYRVKPFHLIHFNTYTDNENDNKPHLSRALPSQRTTPTRPRVNLTQPNTNNKQNKKSSKPENSPYK